MKIAWFGNFLTGASISLVTPFMPLFVEQLGARGHEVEYYAGLGISLSAISAALLSPVWGSLADRYGRKPMMIRAATAMVFTMGGIAFVPNIFWLLLLRFLNGVFAGYVPNSTALIASQAPKEKTGYALGTLSTGVVAGNLMGPFIGGLIAEMFGIRNVFLLIGEDFVPVTRQEEVGFRELLRQLRYPKMLMNLFLTSFVIQFAAQSISPILALYVRELGQKDNLIFVSGLIVSSMGLSSMMSSSILGRLGDRIGNHRLLVLAQFYSILIYLLCANAGSPMQLGFYRFLFGLGTGALIPGVNALLSKITPKFGISRIFSYNQIFFYLGGVVGPMSGSVIAAAYGYHSVFYATAGLVAVSMLANLFSFRNLFKKKDI